MRDKICAAARAENDMAKDFMVGMLVRDYAVTNKYYRQESSRQGALLQMLANDICSVCLLVPHEIRSLNLFHELVMLKGLTWATGIVAVASPSILMDHKLSQRIVVFPGLSLQSFDTEEDLIQLWAESYDCVISTTDFSSYEACEVYKNLVRQCVAGNSKLTAIVNNITPLIE